MANNIDIIGEEAAFRQLITGDFSATNGRFEDDDTKSIRWRTFCSGNVEEVFFPNATAVGGYAFADCTSLISANLPKVSVIEQFGFSGANKLAEIIVPELTRLEGSTNFRYCKFTKFIAPKLTSGLPSFCLCDNNKLQIADVGFSYIPAGGHVFRYDSSLIAIIFRRTTVATLGGSHFDGTKYAVDGAGGAYIYVPRDLISSYQTATNWSALYAAHPDMFRPLEDYTVDGTTTGEFRSFDTGYRWDGTTGEIPVKVADENWMCTSTDWSVTGLYADPNKIRNTSGVRILKNTLNEDGTLHGVWGGVDSNGSASVIPGGHAWKSDNRIHFLLNVPINATDPVNNIIVTT